MGISIASDAIICGRPAKQLRDIFRHLGDEGFLNKPWVAAEAYAPPDW